MARQTKPRSTGKAKATSKKSVQKNNKAIFSSTRHKWFILAPLVVLLFVGALGVWSTYFSNAVSPPSRSECDLLGRVWKDGSCSKACVYGGTASYGAVLDYCSKAISGISSTTCANYGRKYVRSTGCARRWQQTNLKGAIQCVSSTATYTVASGDGIDRCKSASGDSTTGSSSWIWPLTANNGVGAYGSGHYARDFRAGNGATVRAVAPGTIVWKGSISYSCGNGLIMKVKLADGSYVYPTYEHIRFSSASGSVSQGETLGWVTSPPSGQSDCWTGYHLHLGVQRQGGYVESHRSDSSAHPDPCRWIGGC